MPKKKPTLNEQWKELLVGQDDAIDRITPYIARFRAGLKAPNLPIGVFFLMGETGTGKTKTAESLAALLHGDEEKLIRVDCAEFQLEHEVAKMIGAPPGYLGHKETTPLITQKKLEDIQSERCKISIVLYDEVEKAAPSVWRILLGIMDKGVMRTGNNHSVRYNNTIIFLSSNIGHTKITDTIGFNKPTKPINNNDNKKTLLKKFSKEFVNRIDEIIRYELLTDNAFEKIVDLELQKAQSIINTNLKEDAYFLEYHRDVLKLLAKNGKDEFSGARELKRHITRTVLNPIADAYLEDMIPPGAHVYLSVRDECVVWDIEVSAEAEPEEVFDTPVKRPRKKAG